MPQPDGQELRRLERQAQRQGSGLADPPAGDGSPAGAHALTGVWVLQRLWSPRSDQPLALPAAILRGMNACLELGERDADGGFPLRNRVALGALVLEFQGRAVLTGRRPLLVFGFDRLCLRLGDRPLWQQALADQQGGLQLRGARRQPFFALIAADQSEGWLAARGRGGGLALWERRQQASSQASP